MVARLCAAAGHNEHPRTTWQGPFSQATARRAPGLFAGVGGAFAGVGAPFAGVGGIAG